MFDMLFILFADIFYYICWWCHEMYIAISHKVKRWSMNVFNIFIKWSRPSLTGKSQHCSLVMAKNIAQRSLNLICLIMELNDKHCVLTQQSRIELLSIKIGICYQNECAKIIMGKWGFNGNILTILDAVKNFRRKKLSTITVFKSAMVFSSTKGFFGAHVSSALLSNNETN